MNIEVLPSAIKGNIVAPASKSMAHRLLICAGLSEEKSIIKNIDYSEDILATIDCLNSMGAVIKKGTDYVEIEGTNPFKSAACSYCCRESGSTLRFFVPIAMLSENEKLFKGYGRLMERPMEIYEAIAREKGINYKKRDEGIYVGGVLPSGKYSVPANVSSQFISGLLFALSLCDVCSEIELCGSIESKSYIDMTIDAMSLFGVKVVWKSSNILYVEGSQKYKAQSLTVEGDWSNSAFLDAFNMIGGNVKVEGLKMDSIQGDKIYKEYFELLKDGTPTLDITNCPDLAPVLMTLASELNGAVLTGTKRLKIKESDRGLVMKQELSKLGADIEIYEDKIVINKSELRKSKEALCSHNDHRVVMSLAVLLSKYGGTIEGADAVKKSYPGFFTEARHLGLEVKEYDD